MEGGFLVPVFDTCAHFLPPLDGPVGRWSDFELCGRARVLWRHRVYRAWNITPKCLILQGCKMNRESPFTAFSTSRFLHSQTPSHRFCFLTWVLCKWHHVRIKGDPSTHPNVHRCARKRTSTCRDTDARFDRCAPPCLSTTPLACTRGFACIRGVWRSLACGYVALCKTIEVSPSNVDLNKCS